MNIQKSIYTGIMAGICLAVCFSYSYAETKIEKDNELQQLQEKFNWWPTDALPAPVKDEKKGGYWWWPTVPGKVKPWGNRGYIYVRKIIFDYKEEELPPPQPQELRPSLLIKKIHKNVRVYFDYNSSQLRVDAEKLLGDAVRALKKNPGTDILVTGSCDRRGSENYNIELGKNRALEVKRFMEQNGIPENRIRIISRGKLDAVAPVSDIVGMQKDRNAHFIIAEVEEILIPYPGEVKEQKVEELEENVESQSKVSRRQYIIQKNDSLWKIAERELGSGHRWKYLYELNKNKIRNFEKLKAGTSIDIPIETEEQRSKFEVEEESMVNEPPEEVAVKLEPEETVEKLDVGIALELPVKTEESKVTEQPIKEATAVLPEVSNLASSVTAREYSVKKGDTLWKIARQELGSGNRWKDIFELNKEKIKDPQNLKVGQIIHLPEK